MRIVSIVLLWCIAVASPAWAAPIGSIVASKGQPGIAIISKGKPLPLVVQASNPKGVHIAAAHLQHDLLQVAGTQPRLLDALPQGACILIGTLGSSTLVDQLAAAGKIDAAALQGKREQYLIQWVSHPAEGVGEALVIVGSDMRGTIYGIYELSAQLGVSPWYYWADVPIARRTEVSIKPGPHTDGEPAVRLRGIFINDEAPALTNWSKATFGGYNHQFYARVFELILRLKGNFLWPAMWGSAFYDDDASNGSLANDYGIVIGTSHHEPMGRAHAEWPRYGTGAWNYDTNEAVLKEFWRGGLARMQNWEYVATVGMRGDGDEPMSEESNVALLQRIVRDQRQIMEQVTGKPAYQVPQVWALYKEVQEYYDKGMQVPDDIMLLLCDDNWGNVRKLPLLDAPKRQGGYGMYYHFDYVGGPRNYKWQNVTQVQRVWEQMNLTWEYGVHDLWVVNVGDIKPMEYPISFFMDMAWNPTRFNPDNLLAHTEAWCAQQFGEQYAKPAAHLIDMYTKYNRRRTPELLAPNTYSLQHYREADQVVQDYEQLARQAEDLYAQLPTETRDAFYQLVLFPIQACANLNAMYVAVAKNRLYAAQQRAGTARWADKAKAHYLRDSLLTLQFHTTLAAGKWNHMMSQTHIGYTYWQQPPVQVMPGLASVALPRLAGLGVAPEGDTLPLFDSYARQSYYVDIYNKGQEPFEVSIAASQPWIKTSFAKATIDQEQRLLLSIDWARLPKGLHQAQVVITGAGTTCTVPVQAKVMQAVQPKRTTLVESTGCVAIEAQHFAHAQGNTQCTWRVIPNMGKTLSAITTLPTAVAWPAHDAPYLEYDMYVETTGEATLTLFLSPTLNYNENRGLRYAVSIDGGPEQVVNFNQHFTEREREVWVANSIIYSTTQHHITKPGIHTLRYRVLDPGIVLQKLVLDMGGAKPSYLGVPESTIITN